MISLLGPWARYSQAAGVGYVRLNNTTRGVINAASYGTSVTLIGGADGDILTGSAHGGFILGEGGDDTIVGGDGVDYINDGGGNDNINAGGGNDEVSLMTGDEIVDLGDGHDTLLGFDNITDADVIRGGNGSDTLTMNTTTTLTAANQISGIETVTLTSGSYVIAMDNDNDVVAGGASDVMTINASGLAV